MDNSNTNTTYLTSTINNKEIRFKLVDRKEYNINSVISGHTTCVYESPDLANFTQKELDENWAPLTDVSILDDTHFKATYWND